MKQLKNYLVCAKVTDAARAVIEANGGCVEVLRETEPHLELVTVVDALWHGMHKRDGYFSYTLSYGYNGTDPDDPKIWHDGTLWGKQGNNEREDHE